MTSFAELIPAGATSTAQPVQKPEGAGERDFIRYENEVRIQRINDDVDAGRVSRQTATEFASKLRTEVRELTWTAVQG